VYFPGLGGGDGPCPRCTDAGGINDGVNGGTCDAGPRVGLACDANGTVPDRPDYGRTSLDCPPPPATLSAALAIDLDNATGTVVKTLSTSSPNCSNSPGSKCLCDTCNNGDAEVCDDNSDCPDPPGLIGPICGGRRCMAGSNTGTPCVSSSECPGAPNACGRPGEPTRPVSCVDDSGSIGCDDADGDGVGSCVLGPTDQRCTVVSGHAQRGCVTDGDCGGGTGACDSFIRSCFPTGGGSFQTSPAFVGTDTLLAVGMDDAPVAGVSHPTLASAFCAGVTSNNVINVVAGLPGPVRLTVKRTATTQP
jgi:hypothetical protein